MTLLLVVGSSNWVLIYLGLEMQTFSILILLGRARGAYGLEGGLKYFILNGVFSGCLLLGLAYLYSQSEAITGSVSRMLQGQVSLLCSLLHDLSSCNYCDNNLDSIQQ